MSKRTRIGTKIDAQRLAALASRPGIDPRLWCSLCVVLKVVVEAGGQGADGSGGVFADVAIMSTATTDDSGNIVAQTETVRVAPAYAGSGFGLYLPIAEGDEVVVLWPDGDPDHGGILVARAWSASDPPPSIAVNNTGDALLMLAKDAKIRIVVQGQGEIHLGGTDDSKLDLVALSTKCDQAIATIANLLDTLFGPTATLIPEPGNGANSALQGAGIIALAKYLLAHPTTAQWLPASTAAQLVKAQ